MLLPARIPRRERPESAATIAYCRMTMPQGRLPRASVRMRHASVALALLAVAAVSAQPEQGTLRIKVTLADAAQAPTPVQRHALLLSDEPPSAEPRQIFTAADGTVVLTLRPGSYVVESDRPVAFGGRAYQWRQVVEIVAGRDLSLDLTADNAEIVPLETLTSPTPASASREDALLEQVSGECCRRVVPNRAGVGVCRGLAWAHRDRRPSGRYGDSRRGAARANGEGARDACCSRSAREMSQSSGSIQASLPTRPALALACPPSRAPSLDDGQAIVSITVPHVGEKELVRGEVTALQPRRVETDLRLPFGGSGGPVFNDAGAVVGLTSMAVEPDSRPDDAAVVPTVFICEALAASLPMLSGAEPPAATRLPVDPARPYPAGALEDAREARRRTRLFLSCRRRTSMWPSSRRRWCIAHGSGLVGRAAQSGRSPEAEARLGRLTEFGAWSDYFSTLPAVLIVRVTPKMVEGFWKRLGREAARTQGADAAAVQGLQDQLPAHARDLRRGRGHTHPPVRARAPRDGEERHP